MSDAAPLPAADREEAARLYPRKNLFLMATLVVGGANRAVRVRNLSASGALVEAARLPPSGGRAILQRGGLHAECELVWQADGRGGLKFATPIDLADWIPGASAQNQMQVDRAIADAAATRGADPSSSAAPDPLAEIDPGLLRRTADELAFVSRRLEALGSNLANDPHVVMRHATSLQELVLSMQILGHISRLLVADRPEEVVNAIAMTDLRRRLQRGTPI